MPPGEPSLRSLLDLHDRLQETFALHQEALLDRDLGTARARLEEFEREIRGHIRHEDEVLLPLYRERGGEAPGAGVDLFLAEHRKIEAFLEELRERLAVLAHRVPGKRDVLALLDREATFKGLLDHHDRRERNALYPALERATTPRERAVLLGLHGTSGPRVLDRVPPADLDSRAKASTQDG